MACTAGRGTLGMWGTPYNKCYTRTVKGTLPPGSKDLIIIYSAKSSTQVTSTIILHTRLLNTWTIGAGILLNPEVKSLNPTNFRLLDNATSLRRTVGSAGEKLVAVKELNSGTILREPY